STSNPKGVRLTFANLASNVDAIIERTSLGEGDVIVSWLPPYHDMGLVAGILLPLRLGIPATLMSPSAFLQKPSRWLEAIARDRGTLCGAPNFAYDLCVRRTTPAAREALDLRSWRIAFSGAERVRASTLDRFAEAFAPAGFSRRALRPCYGLAEATLAVTIGEGEMAEATLDAEALGRGLASPPREGAPSAVVVGCGTPVVQCEVAVVDPQTHRR